MTTPEIKTILNKTMTDKLKELLDWVKQNKQSENGSESGERAIPSFDYIDYDDLVVKIKELEIKSIIKQVNDNETLEAARPKVAAYLRDCEDTEVRKYVSDRWRIIAGRYVDTKRLSRQY